MLPITRAAILGLLVSGFGGLPAHAVGTTWTWSGAGPDNFWSDGSNWTSQAGGPPALNSTVVLAGSNGLAPNNNIASLSISALTFQAGSGAFVLGGNTLSVGNGGIAQLSTETETIAMPLFLTADSSFFASSGPLVLGQVDGAHRLTLAGSAAITLAASVGGQTALTSVSESGGGIIVSGGVTTAGAQTYNGSMSLGGAATLTSSSGTISTMSVAGNNFGLAVNAPAGVFNCAGSLTGLDSLTDTAVSTTIQTGTIAAINNISFSGTLNLGGAATFSSTSGTISLPAVQCNGFSLALLAPRGAVTVSGAMTLGSTTTVAATVANFSSLLNNSGTLVLIGGTTTVSNPFTNFGTLRVVNGGELDFADSVVNHGIIDVIDGTAIFQSNFSNLGSLVTAGSINISDVAVSGSDVIAQIQSYSGHTYQLQKSATLLSPAWAGVGASQTGSGAVLTFTDSGGAAAAAGFYRLQCTTP